MRERDLFHLRLGDSSSPRVQYGMRKMLPKEQQPDDSTAKGNPLSSLASSAEQLAAKPRVRSRGGVPLKCTCIHSSSSSTIAVGFDRGVVHIYHRYGSDDDDRRSSEEERWKRSVLYPTRAKSSSPSATVPDISCVSLSPGGGMLAVGTSDGFVFVTQAPPPPPPANAKSGSGRSTLQPREAGFHHKSHNGRRVNCLLWDNAGDRLFSVCDGGVVVMAKNLERRRGAPSGGAAGMIGMMTLLGIHQPEQAQGGRIDPARPEALIVGEARSPGVQLDLGRTRSFVADGTGQATVKDCDVLLVMSRKRAMLLYFAVGENVSLVAPRKTFVDLNVLDERARDSSDQANGSAGHTHPRSPPSRSDLGGCLWGPTQGSATGRKPPAEAHSHVAGSDSSKPEQSAKAQMSALRQVSFAYVAQPGGKLWRVGLLDGEVASTHCPPVKIDGDSDGRGDVSGGVELGQLRAVDVGGSQAILCWRSGSGVEFHSGGEFALLDPISHRFVAACQAAPGIVSLSGSLLAPCARWEGSGESFGHTVGEFPKKLRGAVRVLHGGDSARVTDLLDEGETLCTCTEIASCVNSGNSALENTTGHAATGTPEGNTAGKLAREPGGEPGVEAAVGGEAHGAAGHAAESPAASAAKFTADEVSELEAYPSAGGACARRIQRAWRTRRDRRNKQLALWQDSILQPYVPGNSPLRTGASRSMRDIASGDTSGGEVESPPASVSYHESQGRADMRVAVAVAVAGETKLTVLESLEALDAAERALASARSDNTSKNYWSEHSSPHRTDPTNGPEHSAESQGNGSTALISVTDALIRQTWPVLRRTRSFHAFTSPLESPRKGNEPVSVPPGWNDTRGRGAQIVAAMALEAERSDRGSRRGRRRPRSDGAASSVTSQEDGKRWQEAVSTPLSESPSLHGHMTPRVRSATASEADFSASRLLTPSAMPFPKGDAKGGQSRRVEDGLSSSSQPQHARRKTPRHRHGNLFGPMQNMVGSLLQRSVQAVNDALQPGGGATSDDDSGDNEDDDQSFYRQKSGRSKGGYGSSSSGEDDTNGADGGTTSDTGKTSMCASSDRSEVDTHSRGNSVTRKSHSVLPDAGHAAGRSIDGHSRSDKDRNLKQAGVNGESEKTGKMLLVTGLTGVKRRSLGTLRSKRELKMRARLAAVMDLPQSTAEDLDSFVPPSQYEVRLNVSKGLGLSVSIRNTNVKVEGFSLIDGKEIGPAQKSEKIHAGDSIVCVNRQQLNELRYNEIVNLLKGMLTARGDQMLLLRLAYAEDPATQPLLPPPPPLPPSISSAPTKPRKLTRQSSLENPTPRELEAPDKHSDANDEAVRSESWHGSRRKTREKRPETARSVSPPHAAKTLVLGDESQSAGVGDSVDASRRHSVLSVDSRESRADSALESEGPPEEGRGDKRRRVEGKLDQGLGILRGAGWKLLYSREELRPKGKRTVGELWGEHESGYGQVDGGSRHMFLGDMGHAKAQRILRSIAQDVQGLYRIAHTSEESRFFHGQARRSLADDVNPSLKAGTPRPSSLLAGPTSQLSPLALARRRDGLNKGSPPPPPSLPKEFYRTRRQRRPRRRRSSFTFPTKSGSSGWDLRNEGNAAEGKRGAIDLPLCRRVMQAELWRLEGDLERRAARVMRRNRRSSVSRVVGKILRKSDRPGMSLDASPSPTSDIHYRGRQSFSSGVSVHGKLGRRDTVGLEASGWELTSGESSTNRCSDGYADSDGSTSAALTTTGQSQSKSRAGRRYDGNDRKLLGRDSVRTVAGEDEQELGQNEEERALDVYLDAVNTNGMEEELLGTLAGEVMGVDPPRPVPELAYDLQTVLESVQHFATQTLAAVVTAQATKKDLDADFGSQGVRSPRMTMGGRGTAAAKEAKEGDAAAGSRVGWRALWPPEKLTAALGLVTAKQMAHAMRCDAEPLIQVWMRCFKPIDVKFRDRIWSALCPSALDSAEEHAGGYHRQLVCGLLTLFAQVHMSWPYLARPSDDVSDKGLLSLRLNSTWFCISEGGDVEYGASESSSRDGVGERVHEGGDDGREQPKVSDEQGPLQWEEEKAVEFIQEYGAYLEVDAMAAAASCREMEWALHEVLQLAEQCADYRFTERELHQLLRASRTPVMSRSPIFTTTPASPASSGGTRTPTFTSPNRSPSLPSYPPPSLGTPTILGRDAALTSQAVGPMEEEAVRKVLRLPGGRYEEGRVEPTRGAFSSVFSSREETGGEDTGRFGGDLVNGAAPLCVLLKNLSGLFRWDAAVAADMCAEAFPYVRPWNVHSALNREHPWSAREPVTPLPGGHRYLGPEDNDNGTRNDVAFHAYLWAMMNKRPQECRRDWKMVQRCVQLSLRLSARLASLPPDHTLHAVCKAATRNLSCRRGTASDISRSTLSPDSRGGGIGSRATGGGLSKGSGGVFDDDPACRRYDEVVQEVVTSWCRDPGTYDLDPLWLLPKLRSYRKWPVAFQVCAAVTRSWEEKASSDRSAVGGGHGPTGPHGAGLASTLAVFDTLAEACFVAFDDGNANILAKALGAVRAADVALRTSTGGSMDAVVRVSMGRHPTQSEPRDVSSHGRDGSGEKAGHDDEDGGERPDVDDVVGVEAGLHAADTWVEDSRIIDIVRSLAKRCRGSTVEAPADTVDGDDRSSALSLMELAEAVMEGVGPDATGDVLVACPLLLESMPPKFFRDLADKQAALCKQQALEAELLRQVVTSVWAAQGYGTGGDWGRGGCWSDSGDRSGPLGPSLAWLACEELTSFFRHHDGPVDEHQGRSLLSVAGAPPLVHPTGTMFDSDRDRRTKIDGGHTSRGGHIRELSKERGLVRSAVSRMGINLVLPDRAYCGATFKPRARCGLCGLELLGSSSRSLAATSAVTVNVVRNASAVAGAVAAPLHCRPSVASHESDVVVDKCGHGFHLRCMEEGQSRSRGWGKHDERRSGRLWDNPPCPQCR